MFSDFPRHQGAGPCFRLCRGTLHAICVGAASVSPLAHMAENVHPSTGATNFWRITSSCRGHHFSVSAQCSLAGPASGFRSVAAGLEVAPPVRRGALIAGEPVVPPDRDMKTVIPEPSEQIEHRIRGGSRGGRPVNFGSDVCRARNAVERSFDLLQQWRTIATRYDKLALTYGAGIVLTAVVVWLRPRERRASWLDASGR